MYATSLLKSSRSDCSDRSRRSTSDATNQQQQATKRQQPFTEKPTANPPMRLPSATPIKGASSAASDGSALPRIPGKTAQTATRLAGSSASVKASPQGTSPLSNLARSPYTPSIGTAPNQTVNRSGLASGGPNHAATGAQDAGSVATSKYVQGRQVTAQPNVQSRGGMSMTSTGGRADTTPFQNGGGHLGLGPARLPPVDSNARGMATMGGVNRMIGTGNYL